MRRIQFLWVALLLGACDGGTQAPTPGTLTVNLTTPLQDDRAMLVTLTGPAQITNIRAAGGAVVFSDATSQTSARVAVFGTITPGPLLRFDVPDVAAAARYTVSIQQVAGADNELRRALTGYRMTVVR